MGLLKKLWNKYWWSKLLIIFAGLFLLPITITVALSFLIYKKVNNNTWKWLLIGLVILISLPFVLGWLEAYGSSPEPKKETQPVSQQPTPTNQVVAPIETQMPTSTPVSTAIPTVKPTNKPTTAPRPAPQTDNQNISPTSSETISQKNSVSKAKSYLSYTAFSHDGLVAQLEYEQFSHTDAVYGADNAGANWNEQAAKKAKQYMEYSAFSRGGLIDQLKYDKFTQEQAEYGANAVGL